MGMGRDGTGRDGMGWDGMGWDGMGWDYHHVYVGFVGELLKICKGSTCNNTDQKKMQC